MARAYDNGEKYRWTHRCKQFHVEWGALPKGGTHYPMEFMQVADFFELPGPEHIRRLKSRLCNWERKRREELEAKGSKKQPPKFLIRPVKGTKGMTKKYICRRIQ